MASSKFNKTQVGLQTTFLTAVAPTIQVPMRGMYEDKRQRHVAEYDSGTWTSRSIVTEVGYETALTLEGTAFFETLPVLLNSGLADVAPSGVGPYTHVYWVNPAAVAVPKPLTALVGTVGTNLGATGPAVKLKDLYVKKLTLSGNVNDKACGVKAEFFGTTYDDNSKAGFAFASVDLPVGMMVINALKGVLNYGDATTSGPAEGDDLEGLTPFACSLLDWELVIDTGIEPAWCLTDGVMTWSALKYTSPSCEFSPIMRTGATTYLHVKTKADAGTYQNLQLRITDTGSRELTVNMTGLWDVVPTVHDEQDGEVVIKPKFVCQTPVSMTTLPHWLTISVVSNHNWT